MKLYATPISHFSRKVRLLLDLYGIEYEFIDVGNVAEGDVATFGGNPLMKVPVLIDRDKWLIESDHIASYIVRKFDPSDRYEVGTRDIRRLNARAVLNGIMAEEVKVVLGRRTGVPTERYRFFDDALETIQSGLDWLESKAELFNTGRPGYLEFHLVCAWEHIGYYDLVPLERLRLRRIVDDILEDDVIRRTSPFILKPKTPSQI